VLRHSPSTRAAATQCNWYWRHLKRQNFFWFFLWKCCYARPKQFWKVLRTENCRNTHVTVFPDVQVFLNISILLNNSSPVPSFILKRQKVRLVKFSQKVRFVGSFLSIISAYKCQSVALVGTFYLKNSEYFFVNSE